MSAKYRMLLLKLWMPKSSKADFKVFISRQLKYEDIKVKGLIVKAVHTKVLFWFHFTLNLPKSDPEFSYILLTLYFLGKR